MRFWDHRWTVRFEMGERDWVQFSAHPVIFIPGVMLFTAGIGTLAGVLLMLLP